MLEKLSIAFIALAGTCTVHAHEHAHGGAGAAYAIENPLRPGAKAPYCEAQTETADGCTFHSVAGASYGAHLSVGKGESWVASASDAALIKVEGDRKTDLVAGKSYQVIDLVPTAERDADLTVTFDKLAGTGEERRVVERRRITFMVHPK